MVEAHKPKHDNLLSNKLEDAVFSSFSLALIQNPNSIQGLVSQKNQGVLHKSHLLLDKSNLALHLMILSIYLHKQKVQ